MIDFRKIAKLAGLNDSLIEDIAKQLKIDDVDKAYQRGQDETLSRVNTLIEITLLAIKHPSLIEVGETIKRWMKHGIDSSLNAKPPHNFVEVSKDFWYNAEKNIVIDAIDNGYEVYLPHHSPMVFLITEEELESAMMKLS